MNRHFKDAQYYVKRAGKHLKKGITEELEPVEQRLRELTGRTEPEPTGLDKVRKELEEVEERAEDEAKRVVSKARRRLRG
jgi:gas vesicle protein